MGRAGSGGGSGHSSGGHSSPTRSSSGHRVGSSSGGFGSSHTPRAGSGGGGYRPYHSSPRLVDTVTHRPQVGIMDTTTERRMYTHHQHLLSQ